MKFHNIRNKEIISKVFERMGRSENRLNQRIRNKNDIGVLNTNNGNEKIMCHVFKLLKENYFQPRFIYSVKLSINSEDRIMTFRHAKSQKLTSCIPFSEATKGHAPPKWGHKLRKWESWDSWNSGSIQKKEKGKFQGDEKGDPSITDVQQP